MDLYKIADIRDQQQIYTQFWTAFKSVPRDCLAISQTVIIQTHENLVFKSHYCDVIDNSQTFEKILTAVRLTFST